MPNFQSVVLQDRATTPANHTFVPQTARDGVHTVMSSPDGTITSAKKLSISNRRVNGKIKTRLLLAVPVVQTETINGITAPKVVRESYVDATFTFHAQSSEQERADTVTMFQSALLPAKTLVNDVLVKNEDIW